MLGLPRAERLWKFKGQTKREFPDALFPLYQMGAGAKLLIGGSEWISCVASWTGERLAWPLPLIPYVLVLVGNSRSTLIHVIKFALNPASLCFSGR